MADAEPGVDLDVRGARSGGKAMMPIMIVLVLLCLIGGANLVVTLRGGRGEPEAGNEAAEAPGEPEELFTWAMPEPKQLLAKDGVVELQLDVELLTEDGLELLTEKPGRFDSLLIRLIESKSVDEIDTEVLESELRAGLDTILGENQVYQINFREFLTQALPQRAK